MTKTNNESETPTKPIKELEEKPPFVAGDLVRLRAGQNKASIRQYKKKVGLVLKCKVSSGLIPTLTIFWPHLNKTVTLYAKRFIKIKKKKAKHLPNE